MTAGRRGAGRRRVLRGVVPAVSGRGLRRVGRLLQRRAGQVGRAERGVRLGAVTQGARLATFRVVSPRGMRRGKK